MRKKTWMMLVVAIAMAGVMKGQTAGALQVKEMMLSNGMRVWLNEDHSQPKVFGAVVVNAGAKDCPDTGIAHYFEHIMFKGTEEIGTIDYEAEKPWLDSISAKYDQLAATTDEAQRLIIQKDINRLSQKAGEYAIPNEFNRLISKYGGTQLNAGTSWDFTYYHNTFTPHYLEQWCQLNSDRLIRPVYRLFQGELEAVYEEKNMYADDMLSTALDRMMKEVFDTLPYAYPIIGSTENLKNPRQSAMRDFYDKYYVGCNMGLVLCGDIDSEHIQPLLERTFGRIPQGTPPVHVSSALPDLTAERTVEVKIPIPIVSIEMLAYKAPTEFEPDANAMQIAMSLLYNEQAGMLDSLCHEGTLMNAMAATQGLNDAGVAFILVVPNLLASSGKAEKTCLAQVQRLCQGDFSDEAFMAQKQDAYREAQRELETISERAMKMVMVMSSGHTWQDYLDKVNGINALSKNDVVAAAKKYLGAPFVRFKKKNGTYPKDKISQPGYTPIVPRNKDAVSAYAKRLDSTVVAAPSPRLIDFQRDATTTPLGGEAVLYTVNNPVNDLFNLTITWNKGLKADRRLEASCALLNVAGTDSLTRQQLEKRLQALGSSMLFSTGNQATQLSISGTDRHFEETMRLVDHFLHHVRPTAKNLNQVRETKKAESKAIGKENAEVLKALRLKVMFGEASSYLNHLTLSETKKLTADEMLSSFGEMQESACHIVYSGTLAQEQVEQAVKRYLPVDRSTKPYIDDPTDPLGYDQPTVFVYDMPKSRQTLFFTYEQLPPLPTPEERLPFMLLKDYFGGSMSSVLFQEVREFRSMAYSTQSYYFSRSRILAPNSPLAFGAFVGTQGDKAMSAIALVDSLLHDMPLMANNFESIKRESINNINNSFPSFRQIGNRIALLRWNGYEHDSNEGLAERYASTTLEDMRHYYDTHIRHHEQHRVLGIVGNKNQLNMDALSRYGKVIIVGEKDLFRK